MPAIRIVLVDDHAVARRGLRSVLGVNPDIQVVGEAADGEEAVKKVSDLLPDIVLLDISLPGLSGLEAAPSIRSISPNSRIIFVSQHNSAALAREALQLGAYGYVVKSDAGLDLLAAIDAVHQGQRFMSRTLRSVELT